MKSVAVDALRLHPDAERVPLAEAHDLDALRKSLRDNGQQDPIDVTSEGVILDGRTRWTLLRELDAETVQVRVVDMPDSQQTAYIVDRALARRHLNAEQKRALNALLRATVVEVVAHPKTGEEMRIGMSRPERAAKLGVAKDTVDRWDEQERGLSSFADDPRPEPTHIRRSGGNPTPYPVEPAKRVAAAATPSRRMPVPAPKRTAPAWRRYFTSWCGHVLPEDRAYLRQMSVELHKALDLLEMSCEGIDGDSQTHAS